MKTAPSIPPVRADAAGAFSFPDIPGGGALPRPDHPEAAEESAQLRRRSAESGLPVVDLAARLPDEPALAALPREFARRHGIVPLALDDGRLTVALGDPDDVGLRDSLALFAVGPVDFVLASARAIQRFWNDPAGELEAATAGGDASPDDEAESAGESDAPVVRLVNDLIADAARRHASDLHLEPEAESFRVRHRIDGVLCAAGAPPKRLQAAIVSRLKLMANISIAEKRVPQDGRIQVTVDGRALDLRVASLPTIHGEGLVLRLLEQSARRPGLADVGLGAAARAALEKVIGLPDGLVLVTGPTGSGKTTTLYGCLQHLNQRDRKIITVEEPVEFHLAGINQVPVRPDIGMTFASALRAMLRQAPNVVMVGEIRDRETAEVALNAALTGHLVLSTLHTNDAPGAVARLLDLGAKPFLVAAAVRAVVAQRLVRKVCTSCARPHRPTPSELAAADLDPRTPSPAGNWRRGAGCPECRGTGYRGRAGIFEIFLISDPLRDLIAENASGQRLRGQARREGMRTLREDGVRKVLAGDTTIEEVASATAGDSN